MGLFSSLFGNKAEIDFSDDRPMTIKLSVSEVSKMPLTKAANIYGTNWHRLHIDFFITDTDKQIIRALGLEEHQLCLQHDPMYPDQIVPFRMRYLYKMTHLDYPDYPSLEENKEDLIQSLKAARSRIEAYRDRKSVPPSEQEETHEI